MNITVFGASGIVGKALVKEALANGHFVKAFARNVDSFLIKTFKNTTLKQSKDIYLMMPMWSMH